MQLSEKIAALRIRNGLSQEELAAALGVSRQTIGKWETGQSAPGLSGLIALSRCFSISMDALAKDDACFSPVDCPVEPSALLAFLLRAKRATYAGFGPEAEPSRKHAHDYVYEETPFLYRDSYVGGHEFFGEEIVWQNEQPVWVMNYCGRTCSENFSGDFLKESLRNNTPAMPFRGPASYQRGDYLYYCKVTGALDWFYGEEAIYFGSELVYEGRFHGGNTR